MLRRGVKMLSIFTGLAVVLTTLLAIAAIGPTEVDSTAVRPDSAISSFLPGADYSDCYTTIVRRGSFADTAAFEAIQFQRGEIVTQEDREVVFRGRAPGLTFHVGYAVLALDEHREQVEIATVVHYDSSKGRFYFAFVRPIHRLGMPWVTRHVVRKATGPEKSGAPLKGGPSQASRPFVN